ncbi:MAG: DUF1501 domain-containing protein, partial [Candidatus Poribacteria bacterium]|nr:DUF1501 domain-containing protein [Candidatus Poribacteria bacterium]
MLDPIKTTRRAFLSKTGLGLGSLALSHLLPTSQATATTEKNTGQVASSIQHFVPKAKRIIYLFQSGGPSQIDLFDYKPLLNQKQAEELPDSVRRG